MKYILFSLISIFIIFNSCDISPSKNEEISQIGINLANMDTSVSPKNDFYNYVNGNWMKKTVIPEDQVRWGGFGVLRKSTDKDVLAILEKADKSGKYNEGSDQAKAIAIFKTKLDTIKRNELGIKPLKKALDVISSINTLEDFQKVITNYVTEISQPFFRIAAFSNPSNSNMNSAYYKIRKLRSS